MQVGVSPVEVAQIIALSSFFFLSLSPNSRQGYYVYVGVSPVEVVQIIVLSSFSYFPLLSLCGCAFRVYQRSRFRQTSFRVHTLRIFLLTGLSFLGFSPTELIRRPSPRGKESSLFVPSFLFFFRRVPAALCRPLSALRYMCIGNFSC